MMTGGNGGDAAGHNARTGPILPGRFVPGAGPQPHPAVRTLTAVRYETLVVERRGPVGWLVFDRPAQRNAMNNTMFAELAEAWPELEADPEVAVIVNTGAGTAFQTGVDLVESSGNREALRTFSRQTRDSELRLTAWHHRVTKPVIAAVNGDCAGGGLHFVVDADVVIAAESARFLDPHVSVGQVSASESIGLLRRTSAEMVMRMALGGPGVDCSAHRAHQLGIVSAVVPDGQLTEEAQRLAERIATNDPEALRATKRLLWASLETSLTEARRTAAADAGRAP